MNHFFELNVEGNYLRIAPTITESVKNKQIRITNALVEVKVRNFVCDCIVTVEEADFRMLEKIFDFIYANRIEEARFATLESEIQILFKADKLGHVSAYCTVHKDFPSEVQFKFQLDFDLTYIPEIKQQLNRIIQSFKN